MREFHKIYPETPDFNSTIPLVTVSLPGHVLPSPVATPLYLSPLARACSEPRARVVPPVPQDPDSMSVLASQPFPPSLDVQSPQPLWLNVPWG